MEKTQGAVPGIELFGNGGATIDGPEAVDYFRLCVIINALHLELKVPGLRASRFSALKAAKLTYNVKGNKARVVAQLEVIREVLRKEMNDRKEVQ